MEFGGGISATTRFRINQAVDSSGTPGSIRPVHHGRQRGTTRRRGGYPRPIRGRATRCTGSTSRLRRRYRAGRCDTSRSSKPSRSAASPSETIQHPTTRRIASATDNSRRTVSQKLNGPGDAPPDLSSGSLPSNEKSKLRGSQQSRKWAYLPYGSANAAYRDVCRFGRNAHAPTP